MPEEVAYEEPELRMEAEPRAELRLDPATDTERLLEGGLRADPGEQARIAPEIQWEPQTRQTAAREEPLVTRAEAMEPQVRQVAAEPHVRQVAAEPQVRQVEAEPMTRRVAGRAEPMTERAVGQEPSSGFVSRTAEESQVRARRAEEPESGLVSRTAAEPRTRARPAEDGETRRATRLDEDDDERRERRRAAGDPQQRSVAAQPRKPSRGPNGEVTLTTKDDELIVIVPSQMRRAVPRFEDVAQRMARLGSDVQFVTDEPVEGDPSNETYKAIMESLKDAPKVIKGFGDVAEGIGNIGEAVDGMASVGEKAEQHAQETMDDLEKSLPTFGDVGPIGSTSGGRGKR